MSINEKALQLHKQWCGKLETTAKVHVRSREDLALAYTPGVAEPCKAIVKDKEAAYTYTMKANTVAVTIASLVADDELNENNILPEAFDPRVADAVSTAIKALIS